MIEKIKSLYYWIAALAISVISIFLITRSKDEEEEKDLEKELTDNVEKTSRDHISELQSIENEYDQLAARAHEAAAKRKEELSKKSLRDLNEELKKL